jgi:hypothetical protein
VLHDPLIYHVPGPNMTTQEIGSPRQRVRVSGQSGALGFMSSKIDRLGGKRNYKRIGRVQLGIKRAAIAAPDREWTTRQLMEFTHTMPLYRGGRSYRERSNYCRAIRRACQKLAIRVGRRWPDGIVWKLKPPPK